MLIVNARRDLGGLSAGMVVLLKTACICDGVAFNKPHGPDYIRVRVSITSIQSNVLAP